jgi:subtilase family serine protease
MRIPRLCFLSLALAAACLLPGTSHAQAQSVGYPDGSEAHDASVAAARLAPQQADRVTAKVDAGAVMRLSGHVPAWVASASDQGPLAATAPLTLTVVLARAPQVQSALDQLVLDQQNPASPYYRQWLTPQQIGAAFGPTQNDLDAVTAWLTASGYQVGPIAANRIMIEVTAPVQVVESTLHTSLHAFLLPAGASYDTVRAPLTEPSVPAALRPVISAIVGLTDVPAHTHSRVTPVPVPPANQAAPSGVSAKAKPEFTLGSSSHLVAPADFAAIYDLNPVYSAGTTGTGQRVMIIGGSRLPPADLATWENLSGLPVASPNYIVGPGFTDPGETQDGNEVEGVIDFERVYGTAPGAGVDQVIASGWLSGSTNFNLQSYAIDTVNDPVMSMSFGSCEALQPLSYLSQINTLYQQGAAEGISIFASSGDSGVEGCHGLTNNAQDQVLVSISDICSSPYVTCVGGTEFNDANPASYWGASNGTGSESALSYIPEGAWNDPSSTQSGTTVYAPASTGGGFSTTQPKPAFQSAPGVPSDGHRDVPDVSFSASLHDGYVACLTFSNDESCLAGGYYADVGGTSASAPSWAGVAALLIQRSAGRVGNLNPLLYTTATQSPSVFHDATPASSGVTICNVAVPSLCNNSDPSSTALTGGTEGYALTSGYDLATGLGSIDVAQFLAVAGLPVPTGSIVATPSTITVFQTATFSVTLTGTSTGPTPTGTIQFSANGTNLGSPVTLVGGTAATPTESFPAGATYSITAFYSGDSKYSPTLLPALSYVVTNPNAIASTSMLSASATVLTQGQTVTLTDTITGANGVPTGTVTLLIDGIKQGASTALSSSGTAVFGPFMLSAGSHTATATYTGDKVYSASTSNVLTLRVNTNPSSTSIAISAPTTNANGYLIFTGTVSPSGPPVPTGTLDLYYMGASVLQNPINLVNGSVDIALTFSGSGITPGAYPVYWVYSGDSNYLGSTSPTASFTISSSFVPTYTLTPANATVTATTGTNAINTVSLASTNGFGNSVTLSCAASYTGSSPDTIVEPTCSLSPSTINLLSDTAANVNQTSLYENATVTLTSVIPHDKQHAANHGWSSFPAFGGTALAGLFLFSIPALRRRRPWNALACLLLLGVAFGVSGCGSGIASSTGLSGSGAGGTNLTGSPAGSYTVTITGVSAGTANVTTTFTLNLQ